MAASVLAPRGRRGGRGGTRRRGRRRRARGRPDPRADRGCAGASALRAQAEAEAAAPRRSRAPPPSRPPASCASARAPRGRRRAACTANRRRRRVRAGDQARSPACSRRRCPRSGAPTLGRGRAGFLRLLGARHVVGRAGRNDGSAHELPPVPDRQRGRQERDPRGRSRRLRYRRSRTVARRDRRRRRHGGLDPEPRCPPARDLRLLLGFALAGVRLSGLPAVGGRHADGAGCWRPPASPRPSSSPSTPPRSSAVVTTPSATRRSPPSWRTSERPSSARGCPWSTRGACGWGRPSARRTPRGSRSWRRRSCRGRP